MPLKSRVKTSLLITVQCSTNALVPTTLTRWRHRGAIINTVHLHTANQTKHVHDAEVVLTIVKTVERGEKHVTTVKTLNHFASICKSNCNEHKQTHYMEAENNTPAS